MNDVIKSTMRGVADHGWLSSRHTFSFGHYYNPNFIGFSDLRVINDDRVAPAKGFGTHPHQDMEIFSYVLEGALEHKDSMGTGSVIRPGDVQIMSAGSGVAHSEFNHSPEAGVHFLQIWIMPAVKGAQPRYQQQFYSPEQKRGRLQLVLSPNGADGSLEIRQDVRVYAGLFDGEETATLKLAGHRHAYVHVARGAVEVNGQALGEGDGLRLRQVEAITLAKGADAEVLVFDLRPNELPGMH
ncbi:pirin family protein [Pseudoxanthomonas composti]|uniref:Pirin family protein n=1 Tax=Pseudoxanthomonas composti TaxID=2137479 RepID=A0A4Q1JS96_9GAMM|nr:pirin family protein [Pseudoxanthomonas composti]RXR02075.1 pirin family protein [Pseudoxanthomonas composti]